MNETATPTTRVDLTPEMHAFLRMLVREGRAIAAEEVIRHLIVAEMCRWELLHHRPFDPTRDG